MKMNNNKKKFYLKYKNVYCGNSTGQQIKQTKTKQKTKQNMLLLSIVFIATNDE